MHQFSISFDLDGVLADYSGGFRRDHPDVEIDPSLNRSSHLLPGSGSAKKRAAYERIKGTTFYADLPILPGACELYALAHEAEPIILTAAPKFGATEDDYFLNPYWLGAAFHKRNWVECIFLPTVVNRGLMPIPIKAQVGFHQDGSVRRIRLPDERFICTTSARKYQFMHRKHSDHQVLVDDRTDNIDAWNKAGGIRHPAYRLRGLHPEASGVALMTEPEPEPTPWKDIYLLDDAAKEELKRSGNLMLYVHAMCKDFAQRFPNSTLQRNQTLLWGEVERDGKEERAWLFLLRFTTKDRELDVHDFIKYLNSFGIHCDEPGELKNIIGFGRKEEMDIACSMFGADFPTMVLWRRMHGLDKDRSGTSWSLTTHVLAFTEL